MTVADLRGELPPPEGIPIDVYVTINAEEALAVFRQGLLGTLRN
jgi:hypothetical protein